MINMKNQEKIWDCSNIYGSMNVRNISKLFNHYQLAIKNLQKICVANTCLNFSKSKRLMQQARKYKRPEALEDPFYYGVGPKPKVEQVYESLSARGFGKELPSYNPPSNVEEQLHKLCKKVYGTQLNTDWKSHSFNDRVLKYKLLTKSMELFEKNIPSPELHKMKEVKDVLEYFSTPIEGSLHYDSLVQNSDKLPPNLKVFPEGPRFNPATDTMFDGVTAYPGRKRIIYTKEGEKFEKIIQWPHV